MKVLVIGLDGASPLLLEKWIEDLPTFKKFKERGLWGLSIPPIPAQTPVAWTTFMTGKNPGKHGIFSFAMRKPGTYERNIISPSMIGSETLWSILSNYGKRVGVVNVPMAAKEEINGFMIPGFLARNEGVPYPREVKRRLEEKFGRTGIVIGDVETDILKRVKSDPNLFFKRINEITDELSEISLYLLEKENWDFFMAVFMGTDRIQHFFWKYIEEIHQEKESEYGLKIKKYYQKLDQIIDKFLSAIPKDTLTILLSDHGFCPIQKEVLLNDYLKKKGILKVRGGKIDLERSKAVSYGYGDLWLNVKGREPKGVIQQGEEYNEVREEIIQFLENLEIDGEKPIKKVLKREEIYLGPLIRNAPDLMTIFNTGWQAARRLETTKKSKKEYVNETPMWSGGHDGAHDPIDVPGFLAIIGSGIKGRKAIRANLYDLAPTILSTYGIPIPVDMDGINLSIGISSV